MKEENKTVILAALKRAFDTYPQAWENYKKLGQTILDCTEFIDEKSSSLRLSKGFLGSTREVEEILRKEGRTELLRDFQIMTGVLDRMRQVQMESSREIGDVILITSEFLLAKEEVEIAERE